jgi:hydroxyethylthiazole kinase-like uncharacterized protein yjeF
MTSSPDIHDYLAAHPLPALDGTKDDRGTAVVVGGGPGCPGAAILAAVAALRAGAGKVQIVTHPTLVGPVSIAVPEAYVTGWTGQTPPAELEPLLDGATSVLVGPGLDDSAADTARHLAKILEPATPLLVDALALPALPELTGHHLIALPNANEAREIAGLLDIDTDDDDVLARELAQSLDAVVAVRGTTTVVASALEQWASVGDPALGTAGSGDVLAGFAAGLTARHLAPLTATAWAVAAHATAGAIARRGHTSTGYLARELLDVLAPAVAEIQLRHEQPGLTA